MFNWYRSLVGSYFRDVAYIPLIYLISMVLMVVGAALSIAIVYFPHKSSDPHSENPYGNGIQKSKSKLI